MGALLTHELWMELNTVVWIRSYAMGMDRLHYFFLSFFYFFIFLPGGRNRLFGSHFLCLLNDPKLFFKHMKRILENTGRLNVINASDRIVNLFCSPTC